jgi:hypothetical protein
MNVSINIIIFLGCDFSFANKSSLNYHIKSKHVDKTNVKENRLRKNQFVKNVLAYLNKADEEDKENKENSD